MEESVKIPFYAKAALVFIGLFGFVFLLLTGQSFIIPIVFATIIAIVLNPLVNFLIRKKVNKIIAISISVLLSFCFAIGIFYIISTQISMFSDTYPQLKMKMTLANEQFVKWTSLRFKINPDSINKWNEQMQSELINRFANEKTLTQMGRLGIVTAICKVIFDHIEPLKPWGFLLVNTVPNKTKFLFGQKRNWN